MVKISDKTDYSRFARPTAEDEGIWLDHVEVHLVTHRVGQVKETHTHDPPQDHVIVVRSGRMRWTVEGESLDAGPGDVIVTPAGTPHSYEVLGDEPARVVCIDSPVRPRLEPLSAAARSTPGVYSCDCAWRLRWAKRCAHAPEEGWTR